jgi:DNA-directed RNA polymerase subunit RPC12/RpoP
MNSSFRCTQCGATLDPSPDQQLLDCPYCSASLALTGEGVVFRQVLAATLDEAQATGQLRRFFAGRETPAGMERSAEIVQHQRVLVPIWAFTLRAADGRESVHCQPASPTAMRGLTKLELPAGAAQSDLTATVLSPPEIPHDTARGWMRQRFGEVVIARSRLVYVPLSDFRYRYQGREYHAAVDALTGKVLAADHPRKREAPFAAVGTLALVAFTLASWISSNPFVTGVAYLLAAIPIWLIAWQVARRV